MRLGATLWTVLAPHGTADRNRQDHPKPRRSLPKGSTSDFAARWTDGDRPVGVKWIVKKKWTAGRPVGNRPTRAGQVGLSTDLEEMSEIDQTVCDDAPYSSYCD